MTGSRPFDDDRWPDAEGFAVCFLCGKRIDPLSPNRGTYTPNARACEALPAHLSPCLQNAVSNPARLELIAVQAINEMGDANIKRAREAARVVVPARDVYARL